tara:strand:+ start:115 stop:531 length:417 start_codon:yes stop_codon:yes gene_type:complete
MSNQLSTNFKKSEFKCRDGTEVPDEHMDDLRELVKNLQIVRDHLKVPMHIISGYRSPKYNRKIGGARKSQHMKAKAADIVVKSLKPTELREIIINLIKEGKIKKGGVGLYRSFVHYDTRGWNARWKGKGVKDYKGENK